MTYSNKQEAVADTHRMLTAVNASVAEKPPDGWSDWQQERQIIHICRKLVELNPANAAYHIALSEALLGGGQYLEAWQEREWRYHDYITPGVTAIVSRFTCPQWDGSSQPGKTIYVYSEFGLGDLIQDSRWLPLVKQRCGRLVVEARPAITPLIREQFPCVDEVVTVTGEQLVAGKNPPVIDFHISAHSLPYVFNATPENIPTAPYIQTRQPAAETGTERPFRIGICWAGNPDYALDAHRSTYLKHFKAIANTDGVCVFSLQKNQQHRRMWHGRIVNLIEDAVDMPGVNLAPIIRDFSDLARCIGQMDLIVSVDSAPAHLAGAMGKPVWLLLGQSHDKRWGFRGDRNVWYPAMTIFRQHEPGEWGPVFADVEHELAIILQSRRSSVPVAMG